MKKLSEMTSEEYEKMVREDWEKALDFPSSIEKLLEQSSDPNHEYRENQTRINLARKYIALGDYRVATEFLDSIDEWTRPWKIKLTELQIKKRNDLRKEIADACIWKLLIQTDKYLKQARESNPDMLFYANSAYDEAKKLAERAKIPLPNYLHPPIECNDVVAQAILGSSCIGLREELIIEGFNQLAELFK